MRRFYFENSIGQRKDLNGGIAWLTNPMGLGISSMGTHADLGSGFYQDVSGKSVPREPVVGNLVFVRGEDAYRKYRELLDWLMQGYAIYLVYVPFGDMEFYRGIEIEFIQKGELGRGKFLTAPCAFRPTTPWFRRIPSRAQIEFAEETTNSKRYDYRYGYSYVRNLAAATAELRTGGHIPAAVSLSYTGALGNPTLRLIGKTSGTIYGEADMEMDTGYTDTLEFSTRYDDSYVRVRAEDGTVINRIDSVDVTKNVFFRVPREETCYLTMASETLLAGSITVSLYDYYRSV